MPPRQDSGCWGTPPTFQWLPLLLRHSSTSSSHRIITPRPRSFDSVTRTWGVSEGISSTISLASRPCSPPPRTTSSITRDSFGSPPRTPGLRSRSVPPVFLQTSSSTYTAKNGAEMPYSNTFSLTKIARNPWRGHGPWFCGDSDFAVESRPNRLAKLHELVDVLEGSQALITTTLTDCVLCIGAAMD